MLLYVCEIASFAWKFSNDQITDQDESGPIILGSVLSPGSGFCVRTEVFEKCWLTAHYTVYLLETSSINERTNKLAEKISQVENQLGNELNFYDSSNTGYQVEFRNISPHRS